MAMGGDDPKTKKENHKNFLEKHLGKVETHHPGQRKKILDRGKNGALVRQTKDLQAKLRF